MRIVIETIPHVSQRYDTVGDWYWGPTVVNGEAAETLHIKVSAAPDWRSEVLVAVHELVEAYLCRAAGVGQQAVDEWDLVHADADEPGDLAGAPYHDQHKAAEAMERLLATWLLQDWNLHEANVEASQTGFGADPLGPPVDISAVKGTGDFAPRQACDVPPDHAVFPRPEGKMPSYAQENGRLEARRKHEMESMEDRGRANLARLDAELAEKARVIADAREAIRPTGKAPELGAPYDKAEQERWEKNKKRELKLAFLQQQDAALKKELDSIVEARNGIAGDINRLKGEGESDKEWFERTHGDASKQ